MKDVNIYIVTEVRRGADYGIGTYIEQLITCLRNSKIRVSLLRLFVPRKAEMTITYRGDGVQQIDIPSSAYTPDNITRYYRNIAYLLKDACTLKGQIIFHFNFITDFQLISTLQSVLNAKIILTYHFSDWSFLLYGNFNQLLKIIHKRQDQRTAFENTIYNSICQTRETLNQVDHIICIAQHSQQTLQYLFKPRTDKISIIPNGIQDVYNKQDENDSCVKEKIRKKYHIPLDAKVILFAGRLDFVKGISYLIEACKKIFPDYPQAHLFLIGEGDFAHWYNFVSEYWMQISFTGKLSQKQLYDFYRIADIGVCPSLYEEFGLVAIEMMMQKCPLITTQTSGLAESVIDNITGLTIPIHQTDAEIVVDIDELSNKIRFLLENPCVAQNLAYNARKRFERHYQLPIFKKRMIDLYYNIGNK